MQLLLPLFSIPLRYLMKAQIPEPVNSSWDCGGALCIACAVATHLCGYVTITEARLCSVLTAVYRSREPTRTICGDTGPCLLCLLHCRCTLYESVLQCCSFQEDAIFIGVSDLPIPTHHAHVSQLQVHHSHQRRVFLGVVMLHLPRIEAASWMMDDGT